METRKSPRGVKKTSDMPYAVLWSVIKSQLQALCKTLSGSDVESVVLTSHAFQYCGSPKGIKFLQDRIGIVESLDIPSGKSRSPSKGSKSQVVWEVVEQQFQALVKSMLDAGFESLILTSHMTEKTGFCGSPKGLKFLKDNPKVGQYFVSYCQGVDMTKACKAENSVFSLWYSLFTGEEENSSPNKKGETKEDGLRIMGVEEAVDTGSSNRKRGRPRKYPIKEEKTEKEESKRNGKLEEKPADGIEDDDTKEEEGIKKRGRGRPRKSLDTSVDNSTDPAKQTEKTSKTTAATPQAVTSRSAEVVTPRRGTRASDLRIKQQPTEDPGQGERKSARKKASFECSDCKETFQMEYLLFVHRRRCKRESLFTSPSKTPTVKKTAKTAKTPKSEDTPAKSPKPPDTAKFPKTTSKQGGQKTTQLTDKGELLTVIAMPDVAEINKKTDENEASQTGKTEAPTENETKSKDEAEPEREGHDQATMETVPKETEEKEEETKNMDRQQKENDSTEASSNKEDTAEDEEDFEEDAGVAPDDDDGEWKPQDPLPSTKRPRPRGRPPLKRKISDDDDDDDDEYPKPIRKKKPPKRKKTILLNMKQAMKVLNLKKVRVVKESKDYKTTEAVTTTKTTENMTIIKTTENMETSALNSSSVVVAVNEGDQLKVGDKVTDIVEQSVKEAQIQSTEAENQSTVTENQSTESEMGNQTAVPVTVVLVDNQSAMVETENQATVENEGSVAQTEADVAKSLNDDKTTETIEDATPVQSEQSAGVEEVLMRSDRQPVHIREIDQNEYDAIMENVKFENDTEISDSEYLDVSDIEKMVDLSSSDCAICGMHFKDPKYMRKHLITHTGQKNYVCKVCNRKYMRRYDLHQHLIRIHDWVKLGRGQVVEREYAAAVEEKMKSKEEETLQDRINYKQEIIVEDMLEEGEVRDIGLKAEDDNILYDNRRKQFGNFQCQFCDTECETVLAMDQHLESEHHTEDPFPCKFCASRFDKYTKLQRHVSALHPEKRYGCSICGKLFKYYYTMKEHEKIHTDEKAWLCDYCGKGFSLQKYLIKHKERHEAFPVDESGTHECKYCDKTFTEIRLFQIHMRSHTDVPDRIHKCDQCPKKFFKITHLRRHIMTHTKVRSHTCDYCAKSYKDKDTLRKHLRFCHPPSDGENEEYPCEHCNRKFYNKGHLKRHMVKHTGERPFVCPHCNKGFGEKKSLENHIRIHTGERPFECKDCGKRFIQLSHLRRHKYLHTQIRNEVCKECGKRFFEKADLQKHSRVHSKERPYKCDLCPMSFTQQNILKCHRRRHTGEKPYVCDICDRAFTQMGAMQCHRRLHTGERPYKCKYCGLGFVSKERMKFHTYSHTGQNPHICHICGKGFRLKFKLQSHLDNHAGVYRHQCDYCSKGFLEKAKLNRHIKQIHFQENMPTKTRILSLDGPSIQTIEEDGVITVIHTPAPSGTDNPVLQYVQAAPTEDSQEGMTEEVVETHVTIPFEVQENTTAETTSAVSTIQFEAEGEVAQATAANLAALYSGEATHITMPSDSIIYQGDENGEEVVYVVIPEDNQTVILS